jgi:hypothetical protein
MKTAEDAGDTEVFLITLRPRRPLRFWFRRQLVREIRLLRLMIRQIKSGEFRLYSKKKDAKTGKRKNLGTFSTRKAAEKHERAVQYFKRAG